MFSAAGTIPPNRGIGRHLTVVLMVREWSAAQGTGEARSCLFAAYPVVAACASFRPSRKLPQQTLSENTWKRELRRSTTQRV